MDKKELKQDIVNEKIIGFAEYVNDNKMPMVITLLAVIAAVSFITYYSIENNNYQNDGIERFEAVFLEDLDSDILIQKYKDIKNNFSGTYSADYAVSFLIKDAIINNNTDDLYKLLFEYNFTFDDDVFMSMIENLRGDYFFNSDEMSKAINHYDKAISMASTDRYKIDYTINKIRAFIVSNKKSSARDAIDSIGPFAEIENQQQKNTIEQLDAQIKNM